MKAASRVGIAGMMALLPLLGGAAEAQEVFGYGGQQSSVIRRASAQVAVGGITGTIAVRTSTTSRLTVAAGAFDPSPGAIVNGVPYDPGQPLPSTEPVDEAYLILTLRRGEGASYEKCYKHFPLDESAFTNDGLTTASVHMTVDDPNPLCSGTIDLEWTGSGVPIPYVTPPIAHAIPGPPDSYAVVNLYWGAGSGESQTTGTLFGHPIDQGCALAYSCLQTVGYVFTSGGAYAG